MEPHRGLGFILLSNVSLPPATRVQRHGAGGVPAISPIRLCGCVCRLPVSLCKLSSVVSVSNLLLLVIYPLIDELILLSCSEEIKNFTKHTISDVVYDSETCLASFTPFTWAALTLSGLFLSLRFIRAVHHFIQFYDIKMFFNTALKIMDVSGIIERDSVLYINWQNPHLRVTWTTWHGTKCRGE